MPKFLIFGGNGMLAYAIKNHEYFKDNVAVDLPECDITEMDKVEEYIAKHKPEYLINCAAYTDVTRAESEFEKAMNVNCTGSSNLAILAGQYECKLVHYSTDFVFKGDKEIVYTEDMETNPVNVYGSSKLMGEEIIREILPSALIIRISWLYGPNGRNFASIISSLMQQKSELKIVSDQHGKTTFTSDVAEATEHLIKKNSEGIYHFANDGVSSRYAFTRKIYEILRKSKDFECNILPIKAHEYPDDTPRPTWSILDTDKYTQTTGQNIRNWEDALEEYVSKYIATPS